MKQQTYRRLKATTVIFVIALTTVSFLFSSYRTQKLTDDMWKMLGITKQSGDEKIKNSFMYGYLYYYGIKNAKNLAVNDRAAVARDLMNYTKTFVNSPAFKKQYEDMRKSSKPQEPVLKPLRTIGQIQKEEIENTEKAIRNIEESMKKMPEYAKSMEPGLEMHKKNLKKLQDPQNPLFATLANGEKANQENQIRNYKERMAQWEKEMPENMNLFIAARLQKMLDNTKDIDYNATLEEKWNKKRFVNPQYERKSTEWKQGFRAGKEVTEPARTFAQKWLEELKK